MVEEFLVVAVGWLNESIVVFHWMQIFFFTLDAERNDKKHKESDGIQER